MGLVAGVDIDTIVHHLANLYCVLIRTKEKRLSMGEDCLREGHEIAEEILRTDGLDAVRWVGDDHHCEFYEEIGWRETYGTRNCDIRQADREVGCFQRADVERVENKMIARVRLLADDSCVVRGTLSPRRRSDD